MDLLINEYCREAGVRNLKKHLEKVYRKVALKLVKGGNITIEKVEEPAAPKDQGVGTEVAQPSEGEASPSESQPPQPPQSGEAKVAEVKSQKVSLGCRA